MRIERNYKDEKVKSVSLIDENEVIDIFNAGSDLYWVLNKYREDNDMKISINDDFYYQLEELFYNIEIFDNPYNKCLVNNIFTWYSEAYGERENAHKLIIIKLDECFSIKFDFNKNNEMFNISGNCPICFCLSGSRNQEIAYLFSKLFLQYQYSDKVKSFGKK